MTAFPPEARYIRAHYHTLAPYTPILPFEVRAEQLGRPPETIIKLDANENPYGPPPEVRAALADLPFPHVYPDPESRRLRAALATDIGVPMENLLVGAGADELIDLLMRLTLDPGDTVIDCPPTFTMYAFDAEVNAANVVQVWRKADFALDMPAVEQAVAEHAPKLLFLTSPNNPDGSLISDDDLRRALALPVLVVLDEAYIEFADTPSRIGWVLEHDNLAVLRTFSKRAALAGLRVGYGAFPRWLMDYLWRMKQPYNVTVAAEAAAVAALHARDYLHTVRAALVAERERLIAGLRAIDYLDPLPSQANFVLCRVSAGRDAAELRTQLAERFGILVRHYRQPWLKDYLRITVGKPEHTTALLAALRTL